MRPYGSGGVKELAGTTALVTGGAVRVDRAIALGLAALGGGVARHVLRAARPRGPRAPAARRSARSRARDRRGAARRARARPPRLARQQRGGLLPHAVRAHHRAPVGRAARAEPARALFL